MGFMGQNGGANTPLIMTRTRTVTDPRMRQLAEHNGEAARSWKNQAVTNGASAIAEAELVTEILDEVDGLKPKRLSDRANKHLRDQFRGEAKIRHTRDLRKKYEVKDDDNSFWKEQRDFEARVITEWDTASRERRAEMQKEYLIVSDPGITLDTEFIPNPSADIGERGFSPATLEAKREAQRQAQIEAARLAALEAEKEAQRLKEQAEKDKSIMGKMSKIWKNGVL